MGRPSRKRPRSPPLAEAEVSALQHTPRGPVLAAGACTTCYYSDSLRSLVHSSSGSSDSSAGGGKRDAAGEATTNVQYVWGSLSEADIATDSCRALSLGVNVEIDSFGVAWLVNAPTRGDRQRSRECSAATGGLDSQDQCTTPRPAQQPVSDRHASAGETSKLAPGFEHDHATSSPTSGALFCACKPSLRERLSRAKEGFDEIPPVVFKRVRSACNPAEALGSGSFLNRSAMKLANIDAIVEGRLARVRGLSKRKEGHDNPEETPPARGEGESAHPLQFVDLCGGPGGFSEYLLRRRRQLGLPSRGWGISLREDKGAAAIGVAGATDDNTVDTSQRGAASEGAAMVGETHVNAAGDGDRGRNSPVSGGEANGTTGTDGGIEEPVPVAGVPAGWSLGGLEEGGNNAHHGGHDRVGRKTEQDPCAWRLDHLRPWCDVSISISTDGTKSTPTATDFSGVGDATTHATGKVVDDGIAAAAAAAAAAPLLEMRVDYGPNGTGDLTDEANMQGFVDSVLASTVAGRRCADLVVADGGFGAARDALEQESLVSPLVHAEALAALLLLGEGGVFVCKLFECWTESTAALVFLLHRKFRRIAIVKPITSRPASGERYLVCTGLLPPPPCLPGCRFTNALRAKVLALQEMRRQRNGCASPTPAAVSSYSCVEQASCSVAQEGRRSVEPQVDCEGGASATAEVRLDAALGVEADMKLDEGFMSYLRLSNNAIASLQAKACARIIDVASTRRGRAWAFRDSNGSRGGRARGGTGSIKGGVAKRRELLGVAEGTEESRDGAAAVRCFSQAWGLDEI